MAEKEEEEEGRPSFSASDDLIAYKVRRGSAVNDVCLRVLKMTALQK